MLNLIYGNEIVRQISSGSSLNINGLYVSKVEAGQVYGDYSLVEAPPELDPEPIEPPTPEELREQMPPISKRQLRLTLVRNGISLADLDTAILAMGEEAIIEWQDASEYRRLHPLLNQVAAYLALSQEQVDGMWQQALAA